MVLERVAWYVGRLQLQWNPKVPIIVVSIAERLLKNGKKNDKNGQIMAILWPIRIKRGYKNHLRMILHWHWCFGAIFTTFRSVKVPLLENASLD